MSSSDRVIRSQVILLRSLKHMKMKMLRSFDGMGSTHPTRVNHTLEDLKPQQYRS
jgi:hypothetical protein